MISKPFGRFLPFLKTLTISLVLWIFLMIILPILMIYKKVIGVILKVKHGKRFGGFLDGADTLYLMPNGSMDCLMYAVLIIRSERKRDMCDEFGRAIQEKVLTRSNSYVKLTSSKRSFGGYPYLFKYDCDLGDFINVIDVPKGRRFDDDYIKELTAALAKKELPKNNSLLWDMHVSNTPLEGDGDANTHFYRYPVIVRIHHCVGDGTSLIAFFIRVFGNASSQNYCEELIRKVRRGRTSKAIPISRSKAAINFFKFWFELIFLAPGRIMETNYMKPSDVNALHGEQCGQKVAAWIAEANPGYIRVVKKIKARVPNSSFTSVVSTAVLASVSSYFVEHNLPVPERIQVLMTILLGFPRIDPDQPVPLENKSSGLVFDLPLLLGKNLTDFLGKVSEDMRGQAQLARADLILNRFFIGYAMGMAPLNLIPNAAFQSQTVLLTNFPGGSQIKVFDGCPVELLVPLAPNFHGIGVTLAILTYDDRFQISLLADKALLRSQSEAQKIVDDVFANIDLLDIESQNCSI